jgi:hypothetical protein
MTARQIVVSVYPPIHDLPWPAGVPLQKLLGALPTQSLASLPLVGAGFVPPVSVDAVARAIVAAATDPSVPGGVMDVWQIEKYESS